jgi:hypothetical protein
MANPMTKQYFQDVALSHTAELECFINDMPSKGLKETECQKMYILNRLSDLESAINGVTEEDFID